MTSQITSVLLSFATGAGIGLLYFGGLLWTVRRLAVTERPVCLVGASFFGRTSLAVAAFYFILGGHWQRLIVALAGVMVIRILMLRLARHS